MINSIKDTDERVAMEKQQVIRLGAKAPKRSATNYKKLKTERQLQSTLNGGPSENDYGFAALRALNAKSKKMLKKKMLKKSSKKASKTG